jgi:hypothetical protein
MVIDDRTAVNNSVGLKYKIKYFNQDISGANGCVSLICIPSVASKYEMSPQVAEPSGKFILMLMSCEDLLVERVSSQP